MWDVAFRAGVGQLVQRSLENRGHRKEKSYCREQGHLLFMGNRINNKEMKVQSQEEYFNGEGMQAQEPIAQGGEVQSQGRPLLGAHQATDLPWLPHQCFPRECHLLLLDFSLSREEQAFLAEQLFVGQMNQDSAFTAESICAKWAII